VVTFGSGSSLAAALAALLLVGIAGTYVDQAVGIPRGTTAGLGAVLFVGYALMLVIRRTIVWRRDQRAAGCGCTTTAHAEGCPRAEFPPDPHEAVHPVDCAMVDELVDHD
jgi:hypothetical protein